MERWAYSPREWMKLPRASINIAYHVLFRALGDGVPVNAMWGTAKTLLEIMAHPAIRNCKYVGAFVDLPMPVFRSEILPSYKKKRKKTPPELKAQVTTT